MVQINFNSIEFCALEDLYGCVIGAGMSRQDVLDECERSSMTPQDYVSEALLEARKQGLVVESWLDAYAQLCKELGILYA